MIGSCVEGGVLTELSDDTGLEDEVDGTVVVADGHMRETLTRDSLGRELDENVVLFVIDGVEVEDNFDNLLMDGNGEMDV